MQLLRALRQVLERTSLLVRVLALVSVGLAILTGGFVILGVLSIRDSTERTLHERLVMAEVMARGLDDNLHQLARTVAAEAAHLPTAGNERTEETRIAWQSLRVHLGPAIRRVAAVDERGRLVWTSPFDEGLVDLDLSAVPGVGEALRSREVAILAEQPLPLPPSLLADDPSTPAVLILSPLPSPQEGLAIVVVDLNQPSISDLLRHVALGATGYVEVISDTRTVLASTRPQRLGVTSDHGGNVGDCAAHGEPIVGTCRDCHSATTVTGVSEDVLALAPLANAPLALAVRQSSQEAFAFESAMLWRLLTFGIASFVVALGISGLMVIGLVRPVKVLNDACLRIAEGDLAQPVPPMGGGEMKALAGSFEKMRAHLKASQEEIRRWGQKMEREVQERTSELLEARDGLARSRDFLATLFDSLEDQVAVIDKDYRVVQVNRALLRRHGGQHPPVGELCYHAFHQLDKPCDQGYGRCPAKSVWHTGRPGRVTHTHLDASGKATYVDVVASPILDRHGRLVNVLEVARDVTDSKRLEEQVIRASEEMATLFSLSSAIACSMDLRALLGLALDHLLTLTDAAGGGILVYGGDGAPEPVVVTRGIDPRTVQRLLRERMPLDGGLVVELECSGMELLCVPIAAGKNVLGEMFFCLTSKHWFTGTGEQMLVSVGRQLAVAVENAQLYEALCRKEGDISSFLRKYIAAQEEERKRIARELHDETAQSITALAMAIDTALQAPAKSAAEVKFTLEPARFLAERASRELGRIIRDLRPSLLDDLGLLAALGWHADNRLKPLGVRVNFETVGQELRLTPELETALFRVAQEAMSNIARHAQAENASLTLEFGDGHIALEIEDDGCGFDVEGTLARGQDGGSARPFGLLGMRERVELLGGTLAIESRPQEGTSIRVRVPVEAVAPVKIV